MKSDKVNSIGLYSQERNATTRMMDFQASRRKKRTSVVSLADLLPRNLELGGSNNKLNTPNSEQATSFSQNSSYSSSQQQQQTYTNTQPSIGKQQQFSQFSQGAPTTMASQQNSVLAPAIQQQMMQSSFHATDTKLVQLQAQVENMQTRQTQLVDSVKELLHMVRLVQDQSSESHAIITKSTILYI